MPLWKKAAKCNRISKLVSDHIHSPHKRGGSLVVETGFPTSLVDLFVKNRDRLKKPSKKKKKSDQESIPMPNCPSVSPFSENSELGLPSVRINLASEKVNLGSSDRFGNEIVEIEERGLVVDDGGGGGGGAGAGAGGEVVAANRVLVAILKTFLVVLLALGTKQFVVGITISAFLLLFMEYAGKHLGWLLKPCLDLQKSLVERVVCLFGIKGAKLVVKEDKGLKAPVSDDRFQEIQLVPSNLNFGGSCVIEGHKANDPFQEIQIGQPSPDLVPSTREIQNGGYELDLHSGKENWLHEEIGEKKEVMEKDGASNSDFVDLKCQKSQKEVKEKDEVSTCDVVDLKSHRSRSGKIRSKIKKLVSNKLSGSKKKGMSSKNEASSPTGDDVVAVMNEAKELLEEDEQLRGLEYVYVYDNRSTSFSSGGNRERLDFVTSCSSGELSQVEMEDTETREEDIGPKTERNSGYFAVIAIVLVGLVWGRVFALAFTLSWYLLLKSAGTLLRKFIERCPNEVSISS